MGIPFSCMHGTNHQVRPDFLTRESVIVGSHESGSYAYVTVSENEFVINFHDYLADYTTERNPDSRWGFPSGPISDSMW